MKNDNKANPSLLDDFLEPQPVLIDKGMWAIFPFLTRSRKKAKGWCMIHHGRQIGSRTTFNAAWNQIKRERTLCQSGKCLHEHCEL